MERTQYRHTEITNNGRCENTDIELGCLYQGIEERKVATESNARKLVYKLSVKQAKLRRRLKKIDPNSDEAKEIRGCMMRNRLGNNGLRALNKRLYDKSWKK